MYISTAEALDGEMAARIADHQARRGEEWTHVHAPLDLVQALCQSDGSHPRLVDCVTLWLSNLMLSDGDWRTETDMLVNALATQAAPVIFVTNEVGGGIVPENRLARDFRDAAGWVNQTLARACDEVVLCVAGYPLKVKPNDNPL